MMDRLKEFVTRRFHTRSLAQWDQAARAAEQVDLNQLRQMRSRARQMRRRVDQITHIADSRLTLPRLGSNAIRKPAQSDWSYRPEIWRGPISPNGMVAVKTRTQIGQAATLYHDCEAIRATATWPRLGCAWMCSSFPVRS